MLDINKNLEALFFTTEKFFKVTSDNQGRTIMYGTLADPYRLHRSETLKGAIKTAIAERKSDGNSNPILIYPSFYNSYSDVPLYALVDDGEFRTFEKGFYTRPLNKPVLKEILKCYVNQKVEPKELKDCIHYGIDWSDETFNNLRAVLGTRLFYLINRCTIDCFDLNGKPCKAEGYNIEKYDPDMIKSLDIETTMIKDLKTAIRLVMQDKKATENKYPIVVLNGKDSPSYVIDSEDIEALERGYYLPVHYEPIYDINAVVRHIYDMEMQKYV